MPAIVARLGRAGPRRERRVARRVGRRARRPACPTPGSRSRGSARPRPTSGPPSGPRPTGDPLRWVAVESPEELDALGGDRRAAPGSGRTGGRRSTSSSGSTRTSQPGDPRAGWRSAAASSKFGMTETELTGAVAGLADGRAAPRPRRSTSTSGRSWARSTPGATPSGAGSRCSRSSGAGRPGFDTFDVGGGFPVGDPGTVPAPARFAARGRGRCSTPCRPTGGPARLAVEPGRFLVAARRAGSWRRCSTSASGADAERVVVLDAGMTELIRPALYGAHHPIVALTSLGAPGRRADAPTRPVPASPPASTARSARAPTPSTATTCRRSGAATSSRSRRPARTPPRWR